MKKKYLAELRRIQESIPPELLANLTKMDTKQYATLVTILTRAIKEPDDVVAPDLKQKYRNILDSGMLERPVEVIDYDIEKQIDAFYTKQIEASVKAGRLPKTAPKMRLLNNKGKQYARRNAKRLRALAESESGDGGGREAEDSEAAGPESIL